MPTPTRRAPGTATIHADADRWLYGPTVTATAEEIRHAERLRRRIRAQFQRRTAPQSGPWTVGVD